MLVYVQAHLQVQRVMYSSSNAPQLSLNIPEPTIARSTSIDHEKSGDRRSNKAPGSIQPVAAAADRDDALDIVSDEIRYVSAEENRRVLRKIDCQYVLF